MIGDTVRHYRIIEKIGQGGMGVVYLAHDDRLDRNVALKIVPPRAATDESARKLFRKEALALAKLNHPNIATVHDFDCGKSIQFLVSEYISGPHLCDMLASECNWPRVWPPRTNMGSF